MTELRSPGYWIGHGMAVIATVLGVYFAAIVGFDVAVKLNQIEDDKDTYYVAESLHQELMFNVNNMQTYITKTADKPNVFKEHIAGININDFVFQASKNSQSVFEIEPKLLSELSIYYFSVGGAINQYYASAQQSPASVMRVVRKETEKLVNAKTLERLEIFKDAVKADAEERGATFTRVGE